MRPAISMRYLDNVPWFPQRKDSWPMTAKLGKHGQSAVWAEQSMDNGSKQEQTHIISCSQHILAAVPISLTT